VAVNPKLKLNTLAFVGGTVTAPRGLLEYLFGNLSTRTSWLASSEATSGPSGRRRRKYGTRQKSSARAGEAMKIYLDNGEIYTVRVTGTHTNFIDTILSKVSPGKVANLVSERGTEYGPQLQQILTT
jgi:hypothetical protein